MTWRERRIVTILTAIALVLAAALLIVLGIRFRQWRAASESGAAVGADGTGTAADPAAYTALTYENGSTTLSFARDEAGQWAWTADGDFPLDDTVIQKILDQLVNWDPQQTLTDEEALAGSGLDEPTASLTASAADGTATTVLFGRATTDGNSYYVRLNGDESTAYILSGTLRQLMDTSIYDMCRLPELPALAEADMESITIRGAAPEEGEAPTVVLTAQVSGESVSWRSDGSNVTADGTVRALLEDLTALSFARCVDYRPSEEAVAICGLDAPEATVEIAYTSETGEAATLILSVGGRLPDKSGRYTRVDGDSTIYLMETALLDPLMRVAANGLDG